MTVSDDEVTYRKYSDGNLHYGGAKGCRDDSELTTTHKERLECFKKPPTHFLHSEDWGLYLRTCCHLRQIKSTYGCTELEAEQLLQGTRSKSRGCVLRLIVAFNHLYSEYVKVLRKLTSTQRKQCHSCRRSLFSPGDSTGPCLKGLRTFTPSTTPKQRNISTLDHRCGDTRETTPREGHASVDQAAPVTNSATIFNSTSVSLPLPPSSQTSRTLREISDASIYSTETYHHELTHVCFPWCYRNNRKADEQPLDCSRQVWQQLTQELGKNVSNIHINQQEYFDRICREPADNTVVVYQLVNHQCRVEHRVRLSNVSDSQANQQSLTQFGQLTTIQLPIALELILPKMQTKIERVFEKCPFIYDPLEVAAELRQLNYDTDACVTHFHKTRKLREIIHEFLPPRAHTQPTNQKRICGGSEEQRAIQINSNWLGGAKRVPTKAIIHDIQLIVRALRKSQIDASRRLHKLRQFSSQLGNHLETVVEELFMTTINNSPRLEKWLLTHRGDLPISQLGKLTQENRTLKQTLRLEEHRRKTVFNMMQEYLGNIRVYCRCRGIPHSRTCIEIASLDTILFQSSTDMNAEQYKFDRVFDCNASQADVYQEFAPSVCSFLDGYNVCFLTYGGEASGKTYTLLGGIDGKPETQGIAYRALHTILVERDTRVHEWDYTLSVAVTEIYNDSVNDLLGDETGIHVHVDSGLERMMDNLELMQITCSSDIEHLLELCRAQRRTGRTALNEHSSRSHLILFARLDAVSRIHETKLRSILALCDLAGFEDIIKAETLGDPILAKEAGYINRSLTALNRVFMSLRVHEPNGVSYRDSKLTYLLKPFFTYSGKCILIVTVRTDKVNLASTQSTLRFGREARGVSLGRAKRQFNLDKLIEDLRNG